MYRTMPRVQGDRISGQYHTHMSHKGRSNACNWTGYKTPFRRFGHLQLFVSKGVHKPSFQTEILRTSHRLHDSDSASHLRFHNPINFQTLDRFRRSWQITVIDLWNVSQHTYYQRVRRKGGELFWQTYRDIFVQ